MVSAKISSLKKGLVLDVPLQSKWSQDDVTVSDRSISRKHYTVAGDNPVIDAYGVRWTGSTGTNYLIRNSEPNFRRQDEQGTASIWFKTDTDSLSTNMPLFGYAWFSGGYSLFWLHMRGDNNQLRFSSFHATDTDNGIRTGAISDWRNNEWHHAVVSSNGSTWKLYYDGAEKSTAVAYGTNNGEWFADVDSFTQRLAILGNYPPNLGWRFLGTVSNFKIWNRQLSDSEILQLYKQERPT